MRQIERKDKKRATMKRAQFIILGRKFNVNLLCVLCFDVYLFGVSTCLKVY